MGVSALHHDSAACLIDEDGNIICASQEERRTKIKNDKAWPTKSIEWCKHYAAAHDIDISALQYGYYEKPWLKLTRRIYQNPRKIAPYFKEAYTATKNAGLLTKTISHHKAHALAACATAPFDEGVYLIVDAIGEWDSTTWGTFNSDTGPIQGGSIKYPHSLGLLYSSFTRWLGLKPNEDEYIVMGAAAYGQPRHAQIIFDEFIEVSIKGEYRLKKDIHRGVEQYLGDEVPTEDWYDWCASIQAVTESVMRRLVFMLIEKYGTRMNLVMSGGVALNCVANTIISSIPEINDIWILPSPGDSGSALGAAAHAAGLKKLNWVDPYLGADMDLETQPSQALIRDIVGRLEKGQIIGWIQGQEEFGPRALGHRSLLADPRFPGMKDKINEIKHRQEFRPFAPAVLEEDAYMYFSFPCAPDRCRYMQFTAKVRNPELMPAICHVDNTARVQTVPKSNDPFRRLLEHWRHSTMCSVLLNTSLNIKGQPLISDRADAIRMLLDNPMDALVIGNRLYDKVEKSGLSEEEGETVMIAECIDYSGGADSIVSGRF